MKYLLSFELSDNDTNYPRANLKIHDDFDNNLRYHVSWSLDRDKAVYEGFKLHHDTMRLLLDDKMEVEVVEQSSLITDDKKELIEMGLVPFNPHYFYLVVHHLSDGDIAEHKLLDLGLDWDILSEYLINADFFAEKTFFLNSVYHRNGVNQYLFEELFILDKLWKAFDSENGEQKLENVLPEVTSNKDFFTLPLVLNYLKISRNFNDWASSLTNIRNEIQDYMFEGFTLFPEFTHYLNKAANLQHYHEHGYFDLSEYSLVEFVYDELGFEP